MASAMLDTAGFDETKYYLGKLCKRGHDWNGANQTLRRHCDGKCPKCITEQRRRNKEKEGAIEKGLARKINWQLRKKQEHQNTSKVPSFDTNRYYLGSLCLGKHEWQNTGKTLRRLSDRACSKCVGNRIRKRYQEDPKFRQYELRRVQKFRKNNPEYVSYYNRQYLKLNPHRNKIKHAKRKASKAGVLSAPYNCRDLEIRYQEFNNCCAYCGSEKQITIDHFVPISKGGADSIGNIIPACSNCNFRKWASDPEQWYKKQIFFSEERWQKILQVLALQYDRMED